MITAININNWQTKAASTTLPKTPTTPKGGLSASKYAVDPYAEVEADEEGEGEQDSSSAALASVGKPFPNA